MTVRSNSIRKAGLASVLRNFSRLRKLPLSLHSVGMPSAVGWTAKARSPNLWVSSRRTDGARSAGAGASITVIRSHAVRRPQVGLAAPQVALEIAEARSRRALDAL